MKYSKGSNGKDSEESKRPLIGIVEESWDIAGGIDGIGYVSDGTEHYPYSTPTQVGKVENWIAGNTSARFGYLPKNQKKQSKLYREFKELDLQSLSYLLMLVVSTVGYGKYRKFHSEKLKRLLGNNYKKLFRMAVAIKVIRWRETATKYKVNCHNEIAAVGQKGKFHQLTITNQDAIHRIYKYRLERIDTNFINVIKLEYNSLRNSTLVGDGGFEDLNTTLPLGEHIPTIDGFGYRLHCAVTYKLTKTQRLQIRYINDLQAQVCEIDIKFSQPFFLFHVICNPELIRLVIHDPKEQQKLIDAFKKVPWSDKLLWICQTSLQKGDFYEDFLGDMLDTCCGGIWSPYVREKAKKDSNVLRKPKTRRDCLKLGFMYLANGGANTLLRRIKKNDLYRPFAHLILTLQTVVLDNSKLDFKKIKNYSPHKNLAMLLQRIEAKFIQKVYLYSGIEWGFLIHDSIVTLERDREKVLKAMEGAAKEMAISSPRTSIQFS